jgi:hypothetical protein
MPDANDLDLEEWQTVVGLIRENISTDKFPFSDRIRVLRSALSRMSSARSSAVTSGCPARAKPTVDQQD